MTPIRRRHGARPPASGARTRGFTLIEVMIVVAIVGILAAIAVPSYASYVTKTRRSDATIFLLELAGEQQRHFSDNNDYAMTMAALGYADATSAEGHYTVSIARPSATATTGFLLTATPVADSPQANDAVCTAFTLNSSGGKGATGTGGREGCW